MERERRFIPVQELRVVKKNDEPPKIEGYTAVFNSLSEDLGGFKERISAGFFKAALNVSDPRALFNHDSNYVLGRAKAGTANFKEDRTGLHLSIVPPDTQFARDLLVSIERGDIDGMSFGFTVNQDGDQWDEADGEVIRTLLPGGCRELFDGGPVTFPAYPETTAAVRDRFNEFKSAATSGEDKDAIVRRNRNLQTQALAAEEI